MWLERFRRRFTDNVFDIASIQQQTHELLYVGNRRYPVLIVDNFYKNPDKVADTAHSLRYHNPTGKHIHAKATMAADMSAIYSFAYEQYTQTLGLHSREQIRAPKNRATFHRSMPSSADLPIFRETPHADSAFLIAGIIYLTPDKYCKGGTGFYRHTPSGAEEKPPEPRWLLERKVTKEVKTRLTEFDVYQAYRESGEGSLKDFLNKIATKRAADNYHLSDSNDIWHQTELVEMKFNRLVLYPAFILHKAIYSESDFDAPIQQRRLTQNFFLKYPLN